MLPNDVWMLILENIHHKNNVLQLCKSYKCVYERRMSRLPVLVSMGPEYSWGNGEWAYHEYAKNWIDLYIITTKNLNYYTKLLM